MELVKYVTDACELDNVLLDKFVCLFCDGVLGSPVQ